MNDDADRHLATVKVARIKKEIDVDDVHSNINSEYEPIISGSVRVQLQGRMDATGDIILQQRPHII